MIKRLRKMVGVLLSGALTLSMLCGVGVKADDLVTAGTSGTVEVKNVLHIAEGTTVPDVTYTYNAKPYSLSSDVLTIDLPSSEEEKTISYSSSDKIVNDTVSGNVTFDFSLDTVGYGNAGVYGFLISESTNNSEHGLDEMTDKQYYVLVYIKNTSSGLEIYGVTVQEIDTESGELGEKVSEIVYEETYVNTTSSLTTLSVDKVVKGDYADLSKTFKYEITFTNPSTVSEQVIQMEVVGSHDNSSSKELTLSGAGQSGSLEFTLGNGDYAVFTDIIAGTVYSLKETSADGYTASYTQVVGGESKETVTGTDVDDTIIYDKDKNSVSYTNTYKDITVTGVVMNNAPFALMIGAAVLAIIGFVMLELKRRKR